jgi:signal transduction histidine kinase
MNLNISRHKNEESIALFSMMSKLSHDLLDPVCTILNLGYLLRRDITSPSQLLMVEEIEIATDEIKDILSLWLDYSKLQCGDLKSYPENFCINQLIDTLINQYATIIKSKNIILTHVNKKNELNIVLGEKVLIHRSLQNILGLIIHLSSQTSEINIDIDTADAGNHKTLKIKIQFQGTVEANHKLNQHLHEQTTDMPSLSALKSHIELRLLLHNAFLKVLNAHTDVCLVNEQVSHFIITYPLIKTLE